MLHYLDYQTLYDFLKILFMIIHSPIGKICLFPYIKNKSVEQTVDSLFSVKTEQDINQRGDTSLLF